jgi:two-component system nitrate/nitrite sensor histidine kinase NarX
MSSDTSEDSSLPNGPERANDSRSFISSASDLPRSRNDVREESDRSAETYHALFLSAGDGLVVNDLASGIVLDANPAFCGMHGYTDMVGMDPSTFIHRESTPIFAEFLKAIRIGRESRVRIKDIRRDGTAFDVEITGRKMNYAGRSAILGVVRDISDQVRAYQQMEERVAERTIEIERRRDVAEALRELLAVVNSRQSLQEILDYIASQSRRLLGSDASALFMPVEERGAELLSVRASVGLTPKLASVRLPVHGSSTGLAYARRKAVIVSDLRAVLPRSFVADETLQVNEQPNRIDIVRLPKSMDEQGEDEDASGVLNLRELAARVGAIISVPLATEDGSYGTLSINYAEPRDFNNDDIALASTFARQAALAIENAELREQAGKAAAIEERQRLARELHDAVTQTLFSASLISEVIPDLWESNPDEARNRLEQLRRLTRGALAEMRLLLVELRPNALTDMPIAELLRQLIDASSGSIRTELSLDVAGHYRTTLTPDAQIAFYRIAQEALNNVAKHAQAKHVHVALVCQDTSIQMTITDDGRGFETESIPAGHLGVDIMTERAESAGASIEIRSALGEGTQITVTWPKMEESER